MSTQSIYINTTKYLYKPNVETTRYFVNDGGSDIVEQVAHNTQDISDLKDRLDADEIVDGISSFALLNYNQIKQDCPNKPDEWILKVTRRRGNTYEMAMKNCAKIKFEDKKSKIKIIKC